jgi:hypothetical protein
MTARPFFIATIVTLAVLTASPTAWGQTNDQPSLPKALRVVKTRAMTTAGDNVKPFVVIRPQGGAHVAWARRDGERTAIFFARSTDGSQYDAPVRLSTEQMYLDLGAESGPHVAVDARGEIYVVWTAGSKATAKSESAGGHGGHGGHGRKGGPPARPGNLNIFLAKSSDDGKTFSEPRQVNDDPAGPEHRFPTVAVDPQGTVTVAWLDKRKETEDRPGFSRVYVARSTDGGKIFGPNVDATAGQENSICHCCKVAMAVHPTEGVFVAFRNDCQDMRDIFLVHSRDSSGTFSAPAPIEDTRWVLPACPMNGPSLAMDDSGSLHAVWSTAGDVGMSPLLRDDGDDVFRIMYRRFDLRKRAWDAPICLAGGRHPRVAVSSEGVPYVTWVGAGVMVARLSPKGPAAPVSLQVSAPGQSGAYPSLALGPDGELLVSWQETGDDGKSQIRSARVGLAADSVASR